MTDAKLPDRRLSFLHTATAHVATFDRLLGELSPSARARHTVAQDILEDVLVAGGVANQSIRRRVEGAVRAAGHGGDIVVCTCSTLGAMVEEVGSATGISVLRIDRALAEAAVAAGGRIVVFMTAASTLSATRSLFLAVGREQNSSAMFSFEMIEGVFDLFLAGHADAYGRAIAEAVRARCSGADVVVLAQVSMASSYPHLSDLGLPLLISGRTGLERALSLT